MVDKKQTNPEDAKLVDAANWLYSYIYQSASIPEKYKSRAFVQKLLAPLIARVGYTPIPNPRFHVMGLDEKPVIGTVLKLKNDMVRSCTYGTSKRHYEYLAASIGADNSDYCAVLSVTSVTQEVFNTEWVIKKVVPEIKKLDPKLAAKLLEEATGYRWQKEVVVSSTTPIFSKIVSIL